MSRDSCNFIHPIQREAYTNKTGTKHVRSQMHGRDCGDNKCRHRDFFCWTCTPNMLQFPGKGAFMRHEQVRCIASITRRQARPAHKNNLSQNKGMKMSTNRCLWWHTTQKLPVRAKSIISLVESPMCSYIYTSPQTKRILYQFIFPIFPGTPDSTRLPGFWDWLHPGIK